jgi:hypothetical protein
MKFLALCHYSTDAFARLGSDDFAEIGQLCAPHDQALRDSGSVDAVGSLSTPDQSRTLRVERGTVKAVAGPYVETPEPFGAFFIIDADNIDEAVAVAKLHPGVHLGDRFGRGGIEVRPIEQLDQL